jgi:RNA polymerase sigma-70 factor (ECF subfamily)
MARFFERAASGQFELETPEELLRLLATMARNQVIKKAAFHQARRRDLRRLTDFDDKQDQVLDPHGTPSFIVSNREVVSQLRAFLSEEEQGLLDARIAGRSWGEIAADVGAPIDRIRKRLTRALARAIETLEPNEDGDGR